MSSLDFFKTTKSSDRGEKQLIKTYAKDIENSYVNNSIRKFVLHIQHKKYVKLIQILDIFCKRRNKSSYAELLESLVFEIAEKEGVTDEFIEKYFEGKMIKFTNLEEDEPVDIKEVLENDAKNYEDPE